MLPCSRRLCKQVHVEGTARNSGCVLHSPRHLTNLQVTPRFPKSGRELNRPLRFFFCRVGEGKRLLRNQGSLLTPRAEAEMRRSWCCVGAPWFLKAHTVFTARTKGQEYVTYVFPHERGTIPMLSNISYFFPHAFVFTNSCF